MEQLTFDGTAARQAAEFGMSQALDADRVRPWREIASDWIDDLYPSAEFTADDLVFALGLPDRGVYRNNSVGALFSSKSKTGVIIFTGRFRKSQRVIGHGNLQRVWRKL